MNILIIENDGLIANSIKNILKRIKYVNIIDIASDFEQGFNKIHYGVFDMYLIDIGLGEGKLTGTDLCKVIRNKNKDVPIIFITSHDSISSLKDAFSLGINDYIIKPFRPQELLIRVNRWMGSNSKEKDNDTVKYKNLSYKYSTNDFYWDSEKLSLPRKSKILLLIFLLNSEKLLSTNFVREKLWGDYDVLDKSRNLRSNVYELRKLLKGTCESWINTVRGEGFIFARDYK